MVLINIGTLTDSELQTIARQEDIEDWESLSREELIEELENIYGDDEDYSRSGTLTQKYINALNPGKTDPGRLPGVQEIPRHYNKTYIHLTQKDASWAYVFWNLSDNEYRQTQEGELPRFVLRMTAVEEKSLPELSYDVEITIHDKCWTVEMPWAGRTYRIRLVLVDSSGEERVVCTSNTVRREQGWLESHSNIICKPDRYKVLAEPLISKEGTPVDCREVRNIIYGSTDRN